MSFLESKFCWRKTEFYFFPNYFLHPIPLRLLPPQNEGCYSIAQVHYTRPVLLFFSPHRISSSLSWNGLSLYTVEMLTVYEDTPCGADTALTLRLSYIPWKGTSPAPSEEIQREVQKSLFSYAQKYCASVQRSLSTETGRKSITSVVVVAPQKSASPKGSGFNDWIHCWF